MVHGIGDQPAAWAPLRARLREAGYGEAALVAMRLDPNNGQLPVEVMAYQVAVAAERLRQRTGAERVDVVAFSMGALVSRYWLQEFGAHRHVRRFVSLSGPHHGTLTAYLSREPAALQMRPGSALLRRLAADPDPFGDTEVHAFWTPLDAMIVPPSSSHLEHATAERTFRVLAHPAMLTDTCVLDAVVGVLTRPEGAPPGDAPPARAPVERAPERAAGEHAPERAAGEGRGAPAAGGQAAAAPAPAPARGASLALAAGCVTPDG
jgi:pimeloyl-ACP methyl ester carboxylesterase